MRLPLACARDLGARCLFLTNAAGSLRPEVGPGRLALLTDHINLSGPQPADRRGGRRPLRAHDRRLRSRPARAARAGRARGEGIPLAEGIYAWFSGPSFETPAEVRMAGILGADLVGMSTVPETILARFLGLPVVAVSAVTNLAAGIAGGAPHHAETKAVAAAAAGDLTRLVRAFAAALPEPGETP